MKKHSGLTIVELLGAIVIFSIATSMIAIAVSFIVNANKEIIENGKANATGTLIMRRIENEINDLSVTRYDDTVNQQLILYSDFEYVFDEDAQEIDTIEHNPPIELILEFSQNNILINGSVLDLDGFVLDDSSKIEVIEYANAESIQTTITVILLSESNLYTFQTTIEVFIQRR